MNEKIVTMMMMITFITIGINGTLAMNAQLLDAEGRSILVHTNLVNNQITDLSEKDFDTNSPCGDATSQEPGLAEGCVPITITDSRGNTQAGGLDPLSTFVIIVGGVQIILLYFSTTYPFLSPITFAIFGIVTSIQAFTVAYFASIVLRSIFGRIV